MRYTIQISRNEDINLVEAQEQARFIKSILEALDIPFDWNTDEPLSISNRVILRNLLTKNNIKMVDDMNDGLKLYLKEERIAEWYKPTHKLVQDIKEPNRKKALFVEVYVNFWTIFEDNK